ncbi:MAG: DUF2231 domain-containing protein [Pseudomonadota bacterium]
MSNRFAGPLHPALVHFPIVAFSAVPLLDVLSLIGWKRVYGLALEQLATLVLSAGLVMTVAAALAGVLDCLSLPRSESIGNRLQRHVTWVFISVMAFFASLLVRVSLLGPTPAWVAPVLGFIGFFLLCVGAHQGSRLAHAHWPFLEKPNSSS